MSNEEPPREERAPEEAPRGDEGRQPSAQEGFREDRKPDEDRRRDGGRGGDDRRRDDRRRGRDPWFIDNNKQFEKCDLSFLSCFMFCFRCVLLYVKIPPRSQYPSSP